MDQTVRYFLIIFVIILQTQSLTPTVPLVPKAFGSLFDEDPCGPPCWFDLVAGQSTAQDVLNVLIQHDDLFYWSVGGSDSSSTLQSSLVFDGYYNLNWQNTNITRMQTNMTISITSGVTNSFTLYPDRDLYLSTILARLGDPDVVQILPSQVFTFNLIYLDGRINVELHAPWPGGCYLQTLRYDLRVDTIRYYSSDRLAEFIEQYETSGVYPPLLPYPVGVYVPVPLQTWEEWLAGSVIAHCGEAYELLPAVNVEATPTPVPELTLQAPQ